MLSKAHLHRVRNALYIINNRSLLPRPNHSCKIIPNLALRLYKLIGGTPATEINGDCLSLKIAGSHAITIPPTGTPGNSCRLPLRRRACRQRRQTWIQLTKTSS